MLINMFWSWIDALRRNFHERSFPHELEYVAASGFFFFATVLHWLQKYLFSCLLSLRLVQHTGFHTSLLSGDWCSELFSSRGGLVCIFQNKIPQFGVTLTPLIPFTLFFFATWFFLICQHLQKKILHTPLFQMLNGCCIKPDLIPTNIGPLEKLTFSKFVYYGDTN